jgi:hypothetical protein
MDPSAIMVVDESLGNGPYVRFDKRTVTTSDATSTYVGQTEILALFDEDDESNFEFAISATE